MKIVSLLENGKDRLGVVTERGILDVAGEADGLSVDAPKTVTELLASGDEGMASLKELISRLGNQSVHLNETEIQFGPCVPKPNKIICVGLNYRKHAIETGKPIPTIPILFSKFNNALNAHNTDVRPPAAAGQVDYEAELCIVIGRKAFEVSEEDALSHVFGYCAANDLSARDLQYLTPQWLLGKSLDGFAPVGPYLVTADEVGHPNALDIKCYVNGEQRQHSNTSDMIFSCAYLVSYISRHMTLEPGDLILTGTPDGVVMGYPPEQRRFLQDGDMVTVEIEKLGRLTNRIVR